MADFSLAGLNTSISSFLGSLNAPSSSPAPVYPTPTGQPISSSPTYPTPTGQPIASPNASIAPKNVFNYSPVPVPAMVQSSTAKPAPTTPVTTKTIPADGATGTETPVVVPPPVNNTSSSDSLGLSNDQAKAMADQAVADYKASQANSPSGKIDELNTEMAGKADFTAQAQKDQDLSGKTQALNDINNKITTTSNAYDQKILALQKNPEGLFGTALQSKIDDLTRLKNQDVANLNITKSVALNDLNTANTIINAKVAAKFEPIQNEIDNYVKLAGVMNNDLTDSEKATVTSNAQLAQTKVKALYDAYADVMKTMAQNGNTNFAAIDAAMKDPNVTPASLYKAAGLNAPQGTMGDYTGFTGTLTPQGIKAFNTVPANLKDSVQQLITGDALLADLVRSRGLTGTAQIQQLINYAHSVDPSFSVNSNKIRYNFLNTKWNNPNTGVGLTRIAVNTALSHLADLAGSAKDLPQGTVQKMNSLENVLSKEFGDPAVTNFRLNLDALASEIARVYKGGVPDASEIKGYKELLADSFSKAQFTGIFNKVTQLLSGKITATRTSYRQTMGREYDQSVIDPDVRQSLLDAGVDPSMIAKEKIPVSSDNTISGGGSNSGYAEAW